MHINSNHAGWLPVRVENLLDVKYLCLSEFLDAASRVTQDLAGLRPIMGMKCTDAAGKPPSYFLRVLPVIRIRISVQLSPSCLPHSDQ